MGRATMHIPISSVRLDCEQSFGSNATLTTSMARNRLRSPDWTESSAQGTWSMTGWLPIGSQQKHPIFSNEKRPELRRFRKLFWILKTMNEKSDFALMLRSPSGITKVEPGTKRILGVMVADILALSAVQELETLNQKGWAILFGARVPDDCTQGIKLIRVAAEQGHARSQYDLGCIYGSLAGLKFGDLGLVAVVAEDCVEAVKWYRKAAEQGHGAAQASLGDAYSKGSGVVKDPTEALKWWGKAAKQGDADGQMSLGWAYLVGQDLVKNIAEGLNWYRKAAEQGNAIAQRKLGDCYSGWWGCPEDITEAVHWDRRAAEQGIADSQARLGRCYANGEGVSRDPAEAVKWLRLAAEQGQKDAKLELFLMDQKDTGIPENSSEVVEWLQNAAEQNNPRAMVKLGVKYFHGKGVLRNEVEGLAWLKASSLCFSGNGRGRAEAMEILEGMEHSISRENARAAEIRSRAIPHDNYMRKRSPSQTL